MFALLLFAVFSVAAVAALLVLSDSILRGARIQNRLRSQLPVSYGQVSVTRIDSMDDLELPTSRSSRQSNASSFARQAAFYASTETTRAAA